MWRSVVQCGMVWSGVLAGGSVRCGRATAGAASTWVLLGHTPSDQPRGAALVEWAVHRLILGVARRTLRGPWMVTNCLRWERGVMGGPPWEESRTEGGKQAAAIHTRAYRTSSSVVANRRSHHSSALANPWFHPSRRPGLWLVGSFARAFTCVGHARPKLRVVRSYATLRYWGWGKGAQRKNRTRILCANVPLVNEIVGVPSWPQKAAKGIGRVSLSVRISNRIAAQQFLSSV
mmetsp:Transcript_70564/g.124369  ORF Transcript_70564/g.124369 Transcript_70564/m.124369 type:complete len:233 (-) Transcript_70564:872-1570(-)